MAFEHRPFKMDVKSIGPTGEFTGLASVYGVKDLQNDIIEKGAFSRTLDHKRDGIPILWQHKQDMPIGVGTLTDTDRGLVCTGQLNLEVKQAQEAYALLKQGALRGLSIGYDVKQEGYKGNTRLLKEVRLWEVSLVTFPANPQSVITGVKSTAPIELSLLAVIGAANELKAGTALSAQNRRLVESAVMSLKALLSVSDQEEDPVDNDHSSLDLEAKGLSDDEIKAVTSSIEGGSEADVVESLESLFGDIVAFARRNHGE